jgi:hypothetical protein
MRTNQSFQFFFFFTARAADGSSMRLICDAHKDTSQASEIHKVWSRLDFGARSLYYAAMRPEIRPALRQFSQEGLPGYGHAMCANATPQFWGSIHYLACSTRVRAPISKAL